MLYPLVIIVLTTILYIIPLLILLPFKLSRVQKLLLFALTFFSLCLLSQFGNSGVLALLLALSLYLSLIDSHRMRNICLLIISYLLNVVLNNLESTVLWLCTGITIDQMQQTPPLYIAFCLFSILIACLAARLLVWLFQKFHFTLNLSLLPKKILFFMILMLALALILFVINIVAGERIGYSPMVVTFNTFVFAAYFVLAASAVVYAVRTYRREAAISMRQASLESMQKYTEQVENLYNSMRAFKHDYVNIIATMYGYIENRDIDGLSEYFTEEILPQTRNLAPNNYQLGRLSNLKIIELKSLITSKIIYAQEMNIAITIEIDTPVSHVPVDIVDLARILGIFLDNAIEAALETKDPSLSFIIIEDADETAFRIANSYIDKKIDLNRLSSPEVSTKGKYRGIGLYNVAQLLTRYPNLYLETSAQDGQFVQFLHIYKS